MIEMETDTMFGALIGWLALLVVIAIFGMRGCYIESENNHIARDISQEETRQAEIAAMASGCRCSIEGTP